MQPSDPGQPAEPPAGDSIAPEPSMRPPDGAALPSAPLPQGPAPQYELPTASDPAIAGAPSDSVPQAPSSADSLSAPLATGASGAFDIPTGPPAPPPAGQFPAPGGAPAWQAPQATQLPAALQGPARPFPTPGVPAKKRNWRIALSLLVPNWLGLAVLGLTTLLLNRMSGHPLSDNRSGEYILAEFVLIPVAMGLCAAFCLRDTGTGVGTNLLISVANTAIAIALSWIVLHEGVICLIIVSPLLLGFMMAGGLIGRLIFKGRSRTVQMSIVPALALLIVADVCSPHEFHNAVTDEVTINAPPERVWQYVIDYPAITEKPDFWLWRVGLPAPIRSTATGHTVGSARRCVFQGNVAYDERLIEVEPAHKVAFDIVGQPKDPEIMDHLDLKRGQMILRDNHDGTTTLIGTSWYGLRVYPAAYYDLWTQSIVRNVHLRVMRQIKRLAEKPDGEKAAVLRGGSLRGMKYGYGSQLGTNTLHH